MFSLIFCLLFVTFACVYAQDRVQIQIKRRISPDKCPLKAENGDVVYVHYNGTLANGSKFDSSYDRGYPYVFRLGASQVIEGWEQGITGMCAGEQRYLIVPSSLGYGRQGYGDVIPPNATLRFEIEMVEIEEKVQIEVTNRISTENCMMKAENGDTVQVHYNGTLTNGSQFDSSYNRGEPYVFELGSGYVIKGWEQGILGMCVGERRHLTIPPSLGYGKSGYEDVIPPDATLIFDIELIQIEGKVHIEIMKKPTSCPIQARVGDTVYVHYKGTLRNGYMFDRSYETPYVFTLGMRQVIEGYEQGVPGMCVGEKRKFIIPPGLAYGAYGAGDDIPPYATLTFEVEMVHIDRP